MPRPKKWNGEEKTHERVVQFLRREHPGVIFRTDFAAGILLPPWLAKRQKMLQYRRGFPDLFIYQPTLINNDPYNGLALELKGEGVKLKKLDGGWYTEHLREQYAMLRELHDQGYFCAFAVGYEQACAVINYYLNGTEDIEWDQFIPKITLGAITTIEEAF